jgi:hypothetical protein
MFRSINDNHVRISGMISVLQIMVVCDYIYNCDYYYYY